MAEISKFDQSIMCTCGNTIYFDSFVDNLMEELDSYDTSLESTKEYTCDSCFRKYSVDIDVSLTYSLDGAILTELTKEYYDKDNHLVKPSLFDNLHSGDQVNLWDGEYIHNSMCYRIDDGKVSYIASALIDEDQMDIFDFEEVLV